MYIIKKSFRSSWVSYKGYLWEKIGWHLYKPAYEDYDEALAFAHLLNLHNNSPYHYFTLAVQEYEVSSHLAFERLIIPLLGSDASASEIDKVYKEYAINYGEELTC